MRRTRFACLSLAGLCLALLTAACGGSAAVTGDEGDPAPATAASGNAVVQGTVVDGNESMSVAVEGTSLSAPLDEEGQFALSKVPAGTVTLRFQGSGVDARLPVSGVRDGQVTTVTVAVSGSTANMAKPPTCGPTADTSFTGKIASVSGKTLVVSGRTVDTSTVLKVWRGGRRIAVSDLKVGEKVKVAGSLRADGVVMAQEIMLLDSMPGDDGTSWATLRGPIQSISGSGLTDCLYPSLVVKGQTVLTGEGTAFQKSDGSAYDPSVLKVGMTVYVEGWKKSDGAIRATLVTI